MDGAPVDDPVGGGRRTPAGRSQPPQQGLGRHVHPDQAVAAEQRGQVQIGGPDDLHTVDVDQLVIEDLIGQGHLAGARHEVGQIQPGRLEADLVMVDGVDGPGGHEGQPTAHPNNQTGNRRVGLVTGPPTDHVDQPADFGTPLVADRSTDQTGQRDDGVTDRSAGQQTLRPVAKAGAGGVVPAGGHRWGGLTGGGGGVGVGADRSRSPLVGSFRVAADRRNGQPVEQSSHGNTSVS